MSEFDKLKDDAEQYAKDHPEQVQKAEQGAEHAVEDKLGIGGDQDQESRPGQGDQQDQGNQQGQGGNPDVGPPQQAQ